MIFFFFFFFDFPNKIIKKALESINLFKNSTVGGSVGTGGGRTAVQRLKVTSTAVKKDRYWRGDSQEPEAQLIPYVVAFL